MDTLVANPGFHHLAFKILDNLDYKTLNTLSFVSKQFHEFMSQRRIWVRTLDKTKIIQGTQITKEFQESNECESCQDNCQCSEKGFQILLSYYKKESHLKELKNFVKLMEKHCKKRSLNMAITKAMAFENIPFIELFLKAPPGLKTIYPVSIYCLRALSTEESTFKLFKYILNNADYWDLTPFQVEENELTLLHYPALGGNTEAVKLILNHEDFNEREEHVTPLNLALIYTVYNHFDVVKAMVESPKINVNQNGYLQQACGNYTIEYVKLFLERPDIEVNSMAFHGHSALYSATCENGNPEIVQLLLQREDIDVNLGTNEGFTPLHNACSNGNTEIVGLLLNAKDINVNAQDNDGETPLYLACLEERFEIVNLLLDNKNIDVNLQEEEGMTPLHAALKQENFEIVKLLLDKPEINVNTRDNDGDTPLHIACREGYLEIAKLLLQKQREEIDVNLGTDEGFTPLLSACNNGNTDIVALLLNAKDIDANTQDNHGDTPLHIACRKGCFEIAKILLQKQDLKINAQENVGETPLLVACLGGRLEIVKLLLENKNIDVNIRGEEGMTPLHNALQEDYFEIAQLLLKRPELDINILDDYNRSPIILACSVGNIEMVKQILYFDFENIDISFALHWACDSGHLDIVKLLLQLPITEIDVRGHNDQTPLDYAKNNGHEEIVKFLEYQMKNPFEKFVSIFKTCLNLPE